MLDRVDVAPARILDPASAADTLRFDQQWLLFEQPLDCRFGLVRQLVAIGAEQLDAIIFERIVAGGNHHTQIGAHFAREQGDGGRRQRPGHDHVHPDRGKTRNQRAFHHIARQACILADHHAVPVVAAQEMRAGRLADPHRGGGGHHPFVRASTNSVGAEEITSHLPGLSLLLRPPWRGWAANKRPSAPLFAHNIAAMCNHARIDALGTRTRISFTPTQEGTFHGFCADRPALRRHCAGTGRVGKDAVVSPRQAPQGLYRQNQCRDRGRRAGRQEPGRGRCGGTGQQCRAVQQFGPELEPRLLLALDGARGNQRFGRTEKHDRRGFRFDRRAQGKAGRTRCGAFRQRLGLAGGQGWHADHRGNP